MADRLRCSFFDLIGPHNRERVIARISWAMWAENGARNDVKKRGQT